MDHVIPSTTAELGRYGEELAARYLTRQGMSILERNWRCPQGELDILARWGATLIAVEVKTRTGARYEPPTAAVDRAKLDRIHACARSWIHHNRNGFARLRVDILAVVLQSDGRWWLRHHRAVG